MNARGFVMVLAVLVLAVAVGIGIVWWRNGEFALVGLPFVPSSQSGTGANSLPTPDARPLGLNEQQQLVAATAQVGEPQDPLPAFTCAFWAEKTCQPTMSISENTLNLGWNEQVARQEIPELWAVVSAYLGWSSAIPRYYTDAMVRGTEPNPYTEFVRQVVLESTSRGVNPGLVFALYEKFFASVAEQRARPLDPNRLVSPAVPAVVADLVTGAQIYARAEVPSDEVGKQIAELSYSPESKAVLYAWFRNFYPIHGGVARPPLAEKGWLESQYLEMFQFATPQVVFPLGEQPARSWQSMLLAAPDQQQGVVLCDGTRATWCSTQEKNCETVSDFSYFCETWLPARSL